MVNLRYHVVTLVAVFLALAMGVVLGAGPLQNRIKGISEGTNLTERADRLEADLSSLQEQTEQQDVFMDALANEMLPGSLTGKTVALVVLPNTAEEETERLSETLTLAGADVAGTVELTPNWSSVGQREYRDTLSGPLSAHLAEPSASDTSDLTLARALFEVLTDSGPETDIVKEILSDDQVPLISADTLPEEPVNAVVLVGPTEPLDPAVRAAESTDDVTGEQNVQSLVALAQVFQNMPQGAVAIGSAAQPGDFISLLRTNSAPIATVDQAGTVMSELNAALALRAGTQEAYGQQEGAAAPLAPIIK